MPGLPNRKFRQNRFRCCGFFELSDDCYLPFRYRHIVCTTGMVRCGRTEPQGQRGMVQSAVANGPMRSKPGRDANLSVVNSLLQNLCQNEDVPGAPTGGRT
jgi:hypothetical protein